MSYDAKDANFIVTKALPNGAATVNSAGIDSGARNARGDLVAECELKISAPALTTAQLPDTKTMTYKVEQSADDSTYNTLGDAVLVQTGAGGAGAAAATARFRLPTDCKRYVRVAATNSGTGNASGASMTVEILF